MNNHDRVIRRSTIPGVVTALIVATLSSRTSAQDSADIWVGRTANRLVLSTNGLIPGTNYHPLLPTDLILHGWAHTNPGFDRVGDAGGGAMALPDGASVWLKVVELDPAFLIIDLSQQILEFPGDSTFLGDENLHVHLTWHIDRTHTDFDESQCVWEATLKLADTGAGLTESAPFTLLFTNASVRGGEFPPHPTPATGDFDEDQDVDEDDARALVECLHGPDRRPQPDDPAITTCEVHCHNAFDFDDDLDVDLLDVAEFQSKYDPP